MPSNLRHDHPVTFVCNFQGSDTWAHTQKTHWFFGKPTFKKPAQNNQILMSYSTVIKKLY